MIDFGRVDIYWKPNCKFCELAKALLSANAVDYNAIELGVDQSLEYFKMTNPHIQTVPAIFVDQIWIGGFTELKQLIEVKRTKPTKRADI